MNEQEPNLMDIYMAGFVDELHGNPEVEFTDILSERAYQLGRTDALIGDEVRSVDYQTSDEILHRIYNIPK
jgi:hypothetical protein